MDHLVILNGKKLWGSDFNLKRKLEVQIVTLKIAQIPSPRTYKYLLKDIEETDGEINIVRQGGYCFTPCMEGYLIFNDRGENFTNTRFKARRDFEKYLHRLLLLQKLRPAYEKFLKKKELEAGRENYETIVRKQKNREATTIHKMPDGVTITTVDLKKLKESELKIIAIEKKFVKRFWEGSYEDYKKFRQRAKKDGVI